MPNRPFAFRALAVLLAAATFADSAVALQYPYFRWGFGRNAPQAEQIPGKDTNTTVEGDGDLKVYGPTSVRARTVAPFEMRIVVGNPEGAVTWSSVGTPLPDGLSLSESGVVSGTPTAMGTTDGIRIKAVDAAGKTGTTKSFTIVSVGAPSVTMPDTYEVPAGAPVNIVPVISDAYGSTTWSVVSADSVHSAPVTVQRSARSFARSMAASPEPRAASAGPTAAAGTEMPVGVVLSPETGRVTGKAEQKGEFQSLVLAVTDADGATGYSNPFTIRVASKLAIENLGERYALRQGRSMATIRPYVTGSGGAPYWTLSGFSSPLPNGLTLNRGTGALSGLPTLVGRYSNVIVKVEDTFDGETVSSNRITFDVTAAPSILMPEVHYLRGTRSGYRATETLPFEVEGLIAGGRWFLEGDTPPDTKFDVDTGKISLPVDGSRSSWPDLRLRVIDLFDGGAAAADFAIELLPPLYVDNEGYGLTAERGWAYRFTPNPRGVVGTAKWSIEGELPAGLKFHEPTGSIVGTPTGLSEPVRIKITLTDTFDQKTAEASYTIAVLPLTPLVVHPVRDQVPYVHDRFDLRPTAEGVHGTTAWRLEGDRPEWLEFNATTGSLGGTPRETGIHGPFKIFVRDDASPEVSSNPFRITVNPRPLRLSYYPPTATVEQDYDSGEPSLEYARPPYSFELTSGVAPDGLRVERATGRILGRPRVVGNFPGLVVTATDADGRTARSTIELVVGDPPRAPDASTTTAPSLTYTSTTLAAGATGVISPEVVGFSATGFTETGSTRLPTWATLDPISGAIALAPTSPGMVTGLKIMANDGAIGRASNTFDITVTSAPGLSPRTVAPADAVIGQPYSAFPVTVPGNPPGLSWSRIGTELPLGLRLDGFTGEIHGTPEGPPGRVEELKLRMVSPTGTDGLSDAFSIKVVEAGAAAAPFTVTLPTFPDGRVGVAYPSTAATATPATPGLDWTAVNLPPGLEISRTTGAVSGTPTRDGTFDGIVITAAGAGAPIPSDAFSIKIAPAEPAPSPKVAYAAITGTWNKPLAAAVAPTIDHFPGPRSFRRPDALPQGLSMNEETGAISGTPTVVATELALVAQVTAGGRTIDSEPFDVTISPPPLTVSTDTTKKWYVGRREKQEATSDGAMGVVSYRLLKDGSDVSATLGEIVPGLGFDPVDGSIFGTPTSPGLHPNFKVAVDDAGGPRSRETTPFSLAVSDPSLSVTNVLPEYVVTWKESLEMAPPTSTGAGTATWNLAEGTLPGWARLETDGSISGKPMAVADIRAVTGLKLRLVDSLAPFPAYSDSFSLTVKRPELKISDGPAASLMAWTHEDIAKTPAPRASGVVGAVTWSFEGSVPGISLDPVTLSLVGQPTEANTYEGLAIVATDSFDRKQARHEFTLVTKDRPVVLDVKTDKTSYRVRVGAKFKATATVADETLPVTWARPEGLPAWATFSETSGAMEGMADAVGSFPGLVLKAQDSRGIKGEASFSLTVAEGPQIKDLASEYGARVGKDIRADAIVPRSANVLGTAQWSAAGLPAGLAIDAATGKVTGTPEAFGMFTVALTLKDSADEAATTRTTVLSIERPLQAVIDPTAFVARVGKPYVSRLPGVVGLRGTPTWSVVGALPAWAGPDAATGAIRGNAPAAVGETPGLRLRVVDAWDGEAVESEPFPLRVMEDLAVVDMATTYSAVYGFELKTAKPTALNAGGPVAWTWGIGTPPAWAALDAATGVITGVPNVLESAGPLTVVATDATGASEHSVPFTLKVFAKPTVTLDVSENASFKKRVGDEIGFKATPQGLVGTGSFSLVQSGSGTMPAGLKVEPVPGEAEGQLLGQVSGPLAGTGNAKFRVRVTDSVTGAYADSAAVQVEVIDALSVGGLAGNYGTRVNTFLATDPPDVKGNRGALTYALSITPPSGLSFSPAGYPGVLRGIAALGINGTWPATKVTVTDAYDGRTASAAFDLKILDALSVGNMTPVTVRNGDDIDAKSFVPKPVNVLSPTGVTWKAAKNVTLPNGVTVDPGTGKLAGKPTGYAASITFPNVRVNATDSDGSTVDGAAVTITVNPTLTASLAAAPVRTRVGLATTMPAATSTGRLGTLAWRIATKSGTAPANAAVGGSGAATFTADKASVGTWTFQLEAKDVDGAVALTEPVTVTITDVASVSVADIDVRVTGSRTSQAKATGNEGTVTWSLAPGAPAWATIDPATGVLSATPPVGTAPGTQALTVKATEPDGAVGSKAVSVVVGLRPFLAWSKEVYQSEAFLRVGEDYTGSVPVFTSPKGKVTYAVAPAGTPGCLGPLPAGLGINADTGVISGNPSPGTAGIYCFVARDDYDGAYAQTPRTMTFGVPIVVSGIGQNVPMTVGLEYAMSGKATGAFNSSGDFQISGSGTLPPGISFEAVRNGSSNNGFRFYGTVQAGFTAPATYTVSVKDPWDGRILAYPVTFLPKPGIGISMASLTRRVTGVVSLKPGSPTGGTAPYAFELVSGTLPGGLTLDKTTGTVSGRMPTLASTSYKIRVTDAEGRQGDASFTLASSPNNLSSTVTNGSPYWYVHEKWPRRQAATKSGLIGTPSFSWAPPQGVSAAEFRQDWMTFSADGTFTFLAPAGTNNRSHGFAYYLIDSFDGAYALVREYVYAMPAFEVVAGFANPSAPATMATNAYWGPFYASTLFGTASWKVVMQSGANPGFRMELPWSSGSSANVMMPDAEGTYTFSLEATDSLDGATATMGPFTVTTRRLGISHPSLLEVRQDADISLLPAPTVVGRISETSNLNWTMPSSGNPVGWNIYNSGALFQGRNGGAAGSTQRLVFSVRESGGGSSTYEGTLKTIPGPSVGYSLGGGMSNFLKARVGKPIPEVPLPSVDNPRSTGTLVFASSPSYPLAPDLRIDASSGRITAATGTCTKPYTANESLLIAEDSVDKARAFTRFYYRCYEPISVGAPSTLTAKVGVTYGQRVSMQNVVGTPSVQATGLPAGLSVAGDGSFLGKPAPGSEGTYPVTVTVTNSWDIDVGTVQFDLTVSP